MNYCVQFLFGLSWNESSCSSVIHFSGIVLTNSSDILGIHIFNKIVSCLIARTFYDDWSSSRSFKFINSPWALHTLHLLICNTIFVFQVGIMRNIIPCKNSTWTFTGASRNWIAITIDICSSLEIFFIFLLSIFCRKNMTL